MFNIRKDSYKTCTICGILLIDNEDQICDVCSDNDTEWEYNDDEDYEEDNE